MLGHRMAKAMATVGSVDPVSRENRQEYGAGSLYQRASDGLWVATIEAGWTAKGTRKRYVVTAKTRQRVKRKRADKILALERGEVGATPRQTVKGWAEIYLRLRVRDLSPKGYNAAASPINRWVVPTIGRKRLDQLTPADMRAVADAQRAAGLKTSTQAATHRALLTMLRWALREGYAVPPRVLEVPAPRPEKSDRQGMTVPEGVACLEVAATIPHGTRWLVTLLYGMRQGESLGLTWDAIDFNAGAFGEFRIEWQLQALPYIDRADKARGFRVPDGHEARRIVDAYHLVRPKTRTGYRVAPLLKPIRDGLLTWREIAPDNPTGLVWPAASGRPANNKHDLAEWHALQGTAGVGHPGGRPYHVHECRNFAATMLHEAGVDEHVITALIGHASIVMSRKYMTVRREPMLDALTRMGERLQLG